MVRSVTTLNAPEAAGTAHVAGRVDNRERRRQRIISAVLQLADEGGYDAVQMRDVCALAKVAPGTLYAYFGSRDELLVAAMLVWRRQCWAEALATTCDGNFAARYLGKLRALYAGYEEHPQLLSVYERVLQGPGGDELIQEARQSIRPAMNDLHAELEPELAYDFSMIVTAVANAGFHQAARGRQTVADAWRDIERTVHRVLRTGLLTHVNLPGNGDSLTGHETPKNAGSARDRKSLDDSKR